jgi:hypothetical protein
MKTAKSSKRTRSWRQAFGDDDGCYEWRCGFVKDVYAQTIIDLERAQQDLRKPLADRDFKRLASPELRQRVQDGKKMLQAITLQVRAVLEAISDTPGAISKCLVKDVA